VITALIGAGSCGAERHDLPSEEEEEEEEDEEDIVEVAGDGTPMCDSICAILPSTLLCSAATGHSLVSDGADTAALIHPNL
jgi:hypothetical protein